MTLPQNWKDNPKPNRTHLVMFAIGCIVILDIVALANGINGVIFKTAIGGIVGLVGLSIPVPKILGGLK